MAKDLISSCFNYKLSSVLFNSLAFFIFYPIVTIAYYLLPFRLRWSWLLAASCFFYMWFVPKYILILGLTIVVDYGAAILMEHIKTKGYAEWKRSLCLWASIAVTCAILFVFKYYDFFVINWNALAEKLAWSHSIQVLKIMLPVGLSFHTFQSLSYVIEVYRGNQKAERHFGIYALYVMFYPQLVAGPIERPQNLLWQFHLEHKFNATQILEGLKRMAWGLCKKVVVADQLAILVNPVFDNPTEHSGITLTLAVIAFAFQIYCDFSGYSDVALGSAQTMGYKLMENFDRPYFATTVSDFWRRWHISLSTWFKDYLYVSLGGNRKGVIRWQLNLFITFLVSGFWHGANWTYVIWGALNGFYLVVANLKNSFFKQKPLQPSIVVRVAKQGVTFSLICFSWIFFRAKSLTDAKIYIAELFSASKWTHFEFSLKDQFLITPTRVLLIFILIECLQGALPLYPWLKRQTLAIRFLVYSALIWSMLFYGVFDSEKFIYFVF